MIDNATVVFANPSDQSYDGVIAGTGNLIKSGGGVLTLSQSSTLTGDTRIYGGTLRLNTNGSIGSSTLDYRVMEDP